MIKRQIYNPVKSVILLENAEKSRNMALNLRWLM